MGGISLLDAQTLYFDLRAVLRPTSYVLRPTSYALTPTPSSYPLAITRPR